MSAGIFCRVAPARYLRPDGPARCLQSAPELAAVVDKLEADHRRVSDLLDAVENAANVISL